MFDTHHSKRPENDRTKAPPQESSRTTRNIHYTGDLTRIPHYAQAWGNLPPPWLRPDIPQQAPQEGEPLQRAAEPTQRKENTTGLPDTLKAGVEQLSGLSMDDVNVHYNSSEPSKLQALAYTQGTEIHVGPGQEKHLAHEAWHVVQQMQGRVKPTLQAKGVAISDDEGLEEEADVRGARAITEQSVKEPLDWFAETASKIQTRRRNSSSKNPNLYACPIQRLLDKKIKINTFMVDVDAKQGDKDLKEALTRLLSTAKNSKLSIEYDWLVSLVKSLKSLNAKNVNHLAERLDVEAAKNSDKQLSGARGHILSRHVVVDKEYQEERLAGGLERVTRIDKEREYARYRSYLEKLDTSAPDVIKQHIEAFSHTVLFYMTDQDYSFATLGNNTVKRDFLREQTESPTIIKEEDYTITADWKIQVTGAGVVSLTCEPSIISSRDFRKIITEKDRDEAAVERQAYEPVTMYWGKNRFVIGGLTPATTSQELTAKIEELDFQLGVTQF